jgi:serine/threonine protein kinase
MVWLAYDEVLHRQIAVKEVQLPAGMPAPEASEIRERTLREARAIAALTHPNVVAVYDVARQGVEPFVVMELVRGRSLAQMTTRSGVLNTEQLAVVADAIAAGLDMAHRRGITHRDVKPGNVLVGEDGQVKLTDFGISRNVSDATMTSSGIILGTPAYMAPEVAAGREVTTAADLWSLGATLFAGVEGRPPYDKGDPLATVNEIVDGEIPRVAEDAPLADVITALMVKDPAERMSLMEVRRRIRPLLPEPGTLVFPPDESEEDAGPADNKPTTHIATPKPLVELPAPQPLATDPGPLPWASPPLAPMPGPLPVGPRPVRLRRPPVITALLFVFAVILFCAAAGGGFVATRTLAGRQILPPPQQPTQSSVPTAPPVRSFTTADASASATTNTAGSDFTILVPTGWAKFVEQRGPEGKLPDSTVVRWVKPDGTAELTVEHFPDYLNTNTQQDYLDDALWAVDKNGKLGQAGDLYMFRTSDTLRSSFFDFVQPTDSHDLWVVSVTVPTVEELSGQVDLWNHIGPSFKLTG